MAKSFDKLGCLAYLCKTSNEAWYLSGILEVLQAVGVQIVILDGPEIYSECVPTRMWRTWRRLPGDTEEEFHAAYDKEVQNEPVGKIRPCLKNKSYTRNQVMRSYEHETI